MYLYQNILRIVNIPNVHLSIFLDCLQPDQTTQTSILILDLVCLIQKPFSTLALFSFELNVLIHLLFLGSEFQGNPILSVIHHFSISNSQQRRYTLFLSFAQLSMYMLQYLLQSPKILRHDFSEHKHLFLAIHTFLNNENTHSV